MMKYINTTLLGGLAAVLPLGLIILFVRWIINIIERILSPLVELFNTDSRYVILALYILIVIAILILFFAIGFFIQTRAGNYFKKGVENKYLMKIPGYQTARDIVMQFFGGNRSFFSEVVLVDPFNSGTLMTGFITDNSGEMITVFVPTGPNPTSGNIYHLHKEKVIITNAPVDLGMKSIISCGAGSSKLFEEAQTSIVEVKSASEEEKE
ncbi:MAG: DUF502 domain-containing protein [Bacteroidales bacterium]|nr:DUF502 domain-containing protein [Bacteroidales bacterium]